MASQCWHTATTERCACLYPSTHMNPHSWASIIVHCQYLCATWAMPYRVATKMLHSRAVGYECPVAQAHEAICGRERGARGNPHCGHEEDHRCCRLARHRVSCSTVDQRCEAARLSASRGPAKGKRAALRNQAWGCVCHGCAENVSFGRAELCFTRHLYLNKATL